MGHKSFSTLIIPSSSSLSLDRQDWFTYLCTPETKIAVIPDQ